MSFRPEYARTLASEALNDLSDPARSLDGVIRKAIRVATLLHHLPVRAWLEMQLIDMSQLETSGFDEIVAGAQHRLIGQLIDRELADARLTDITSAVGLSYAVSRRWGNQKENEDGPLMAASIADLEARIQLMESGRVPFDVKTYEPVPRIRGVLNAVRNSVGQYLTQIEARDTEPR
jgi:hypothetical protein